MSYKYSFRQSPNYTPGAQAPSVWGRKRTIDKIAIHWWGDPAQKPTLAGVVNVLCNPARQASAHYVVEAGQVAQLVKENDASWATNSANPYTISIECNPRMTAGDLDTVGELIANIWKRLGKKGLIRHKDIVATACPGTYSSRLDTLVNIANKYLTPKPNPTPSWRPVEKPRKMVTLDNVAVIDVVTGAVQGSLAKGTQVDIASKTTYGNIYYLRSKYATDSNKNWGIRGDKLGEIVPIPVPPPPIPEWEKNSKNYETAVILYARKGCRLYDIMTGEVDDSVSEFPEGKVFDQIVRETSVKSQTYYISKYSADKNVWKGFRSQDVTTDAPLPPEPKKNDPTPDSVAGTDRIGAVEKRLGALELIVKSIVEFLSNLFKGWRN